MAFDVDDARTVLAAMAEVFDGLEAALLSYRALAPSL
jgi:hypothetical protein